MKRLLSASVLCLGLAGAANSHAQNSGGTYNPTPSSTAAFPLIISNLFGDSITSIDSGGTANSSFVSSNIPGPNGLATNGSGSVYAATFDGATTPSITRFAVTGPAAGTVTQTITGIPAVPSGLTFGANGNLYAPTAVEPNSHANRVLEISPATGNVVNNYTSALLNQPQGIAMGPDGNLYIANTGNSTIVQMTPAGVFTNLNLTSLSAPVSLIFDHNQLFVTNNTGNTILGFQGTLVGGTFTLTPAPSLVSFNTGGPLATVLNGPEGITVGPDGNFYVANDGSTTNGVSNIDLITATRDPVTGAVTALGAPTVFSTESAALGASFVVFVPEPSTYAMFAVAGVALAFFGIRRRMTLRA